MKLAKSIGLILALVIGLVAGVSVSGYAETDVTSKVQVIKSALSYDRVAKQSFLNVSVKNISNEVLLTPITVVIKAVSPATITVANADGTMNSGEAYFDFKLVINGTSNEFSPGQTTQSKRVIFNNPSAAKFTYSVSVMGSEAPVTLNTPPSETISIGLDLGGEQLIPVTTRKYVGIVELPHGSPLNVTSLVVESGIANRTSLTSQGLFKAEMNNDATTLLTVTNGADKSYLMKLYPKSSDIKEVNPSINTKSTAVSLIALQAGAISGRPNIDALILAIISKLPETQNLAAQITEELQQGIFNLQGHLSSTTLEKCAAAHNALARATITDVLAYNFLHRLNNNVERIIDKLIPNAIADGLLNRNCSDVRSELLYDVDGIDQDGVCLSGNIRAAGEESNFYLENKYHRWAALGLKTSTGNLEHIDWVQPARLSYPRLQELIIT